MSSSRERPESPIYEGNSDSDSEAEIRCLLEIAVLYFSVVKAQYPNSPYNEVMNRTKCPSTALFRRLYEMAEPDTFYTPSSLCQLKNHQRTNAIRILSEIRTFQGGIAASVLSHILQMKSVSFGLQAYGSSSFGGNRSISIGRNWVCRKVTKNGQMSYRGRMYCLGAKYKGKSAKIQEKNDVLNVKVSGFPMFRLAIRTKK